MTQPSPPPGSQSRPTLLVASLTILAVLAIALIGGKYLIDRVIEVPDKVAQGLGNAFRPQVIVSTVITGTIHDLKNTPKLVVLTTGIDAQIHKSSSTSALWIYWGTTSVDVRATDNQVQFYVPLEGLQTSSFSYDDLHKILTIRVPAPLLDESFVDVQTDPRKVEIQTSNGWAKLDRFSGAPLRQEALSELRAAVLAAANEPSNHELLELKAKENARDQITKLLQSLTDSLRPEVKLEVQFNEN